MGESDFLQRMNAFPLRAILTSALALIILTGRTWADEAGKLRDLLTAEWDYTMQENPTWASGLGDRRWNDKWSDESPEHLAKRAEHDRDLLKKLDGIDRAQLSAQDRLNYDMKKYQATLALDEYAQRLWTLPMNQREGIQLLDEMTSSLRFETVKDYEDWIMRLTALPSVVDQTIVLMRLGIAEKRIHAKVALDGVPAQIAKQIVEKPEDSPFYKPFQKMPAGLSPAEVERLQAAVRNAIATEVVPAYRRFNDFFSKEYLPACTDQPGAWQWPHGDEAYAFLARKFTTTRLTPEEIHQIGLNEVERITKEMQKIMDQVGWKGTRQEFFDSLRHDPRFYYRTSEELLEGYRAVAKRIDPTLVKVLKTLPRAPYGVEPIPAISAPNTTAAYYRPLAADGSRPGTFCVNLYRPPMRPKYEMMALALHESVPGHHLQFAVAFEQGDLPNFRRYGGDGAYTAYVEGWALYAESLGDELGLYDDPYSKFGQLTYEIWRACRLVVDTGMHAKHWGRQQAIDYLMDHSAKTELDVDNEIDRYISWPGQALAYKIGELKIKELRERAKKALGAKFDVRDFHEVVLRSGPVPLEVLERNVDDWLAASKQG